MLCPPKKSAGAVKNDTEFGSHGEFTPCFRKSKGVKDRIWASLHNVYIDQLLSGTTGRERRESESCNPQ